MNDATLPDACATLAPLLSGLLDGELSGSERMAVEQHLEDCPACVRSLETARASRRALRNTAGMLPAPQSMRARVRVDLARERGEAQRRRWRLVLVTVAGIAALVAAIALLGTLVLAPPVRQDALLRRAVAVHQATVAGSAPLHTGDSTAAAARWVSAELGQSVDVPRLETFGYRFLGARPEPTAAAHAVAMVYAGEDGTLTCLVLPGHQQLSGSGHAGAPVHLGQIQGTALAGWWEEEATYVLAGNVAPDVLLKLAQAAAQQ
jgi:anti-sigma factor (TIGR02949 family)